MLNDRPEIVRKRLRRTVAKGASVAVSAIAFFELSYGVARSKRRRENEERLRVFASGNIQVLPFDEEDAIAAGELRAELETAGTPIGAYDLLIAAQARWRAATLITANVSEFARVSGLAWEDWTAKS